MQSQIWMHRGNQQGLSEDHAERSKVCLALGHNLGVPTDKHCHLIPGRISSALQRIAIIPLKMCSTKRLLSPRN